MKKSFTVHDLPKKSQRKYDIIEIMATINIPKNLLKEKELMIISKKEYQKLKEQLKELFILLNSVVEGNKLLTQKKTRSFKEFLSSLEKSR